MNKPSQTLLEVRNLQHTIAGRSVLFSKFNTSIMFNEKVAIIGSSGTGKSTLLHLLAGLSQAQSGQILYKQQDYSKITPQQLAMLHNHEIAFIYQQGFWLSDFTVLENVAMPLLIRAIHRSDAFEKAHSTLKRLELDHKANEDPCVLSGGERQRMCIARACIIEPKLIIADEPTGQLDKASTEKILDILYHQITNTATIIATHDPIVWKQSERIIDLNNLE